MKEGDVINMDPVSHKVILRALHVSRRESKLGHFYATPLILQSVSGHVHEDASIAPTSHTVLTVQSFDFKVGCRERTRFCNCNADTCLLSSPFRKENTTNERSVKTWHFRNRKRWQ